MKLFSVKYQYVDLSVQRVKSNCIIFLNFLNKTADNVYVCNALPLIY